ncbi:uncharacterized protein LOC126703243 [Quercus robur]|uniref:Uncharacterized protein n=1 Tax=Quercus lobata TaxID=97700 RepID=A0A7N2MQY5_QUELO|nr:uncharacterized protein LOC115965771 [Quercus lobata]XP_050258155.1 uncharacterized protein LOC126703243 [Quercus robur]
MATTSPSLPMQQQPAGETLTYNPVAVPNNNAAWSSSGSIGPFFAVMSVLTVLAILSCLLGRMCTKEAVTPLESIKDSGCLGWVKRKCRQSMSCDVKVGMKMMAFGKGRNDCNVKDGEVQQLPQP